LFPFASAIVLFSLFPSKSKLLFMNVKCDWFGLGTASYVGVKEYVPAYLDSTLSIQEMMTGVSFASGGSGYDPLTPRLSVIPISLSRKYRQQNIVYIYHAFVPQSGELRSEISSEVARLIPFFVGKLHKLIERLTGTHVICSNGNGCHKPLQFLYLINLKKKKKKKKEKGGCHT